MYNLQVTRCILSKFYIKPQLDLRSIVILLVVSYRNSTSNHNPFSSTSGTSTLYLIEILHQTTTWLVASLPAVWLYLIEILHQTTTGRYAAGLPGQLYLIEILHQTTTTLPAKANYFGCILSKFYIKPQQC